MGKIKVAIVIDSLCVGGAQRVVCELLRNIDYSEFDVSLHCFFGGSDEAFLGLVSKTPARIHMHGEGDRIDFSTGLRMYKTFSKERPDVVHAHLGGVQVSMPWVLMHGRKMLVTLHSTLPAGLGSTARRLVGLAGHKRVRLVAVSDENHKQACDYLGLEDGQVEEVDNGITLTDYSPCDIDGAPVFINVATQNANKNQALIVRAFERVKAECPEARLILVGDGPLHTELVKTTAADPSIELPGALSDVPGALSRANVYVQSSNREGMPMSILEAMACGMPVVSTDVGGIRNVVAEENGALVEAGSEEQLCRAMLAMASPGLRHAKGAASLKRAERYSAALMARRYERLYRELSGRTAVDE